MLFRQHPVAQSAMFLLYSTPYNTTYNIHMYRDAVRVKVQILPFYMHDTTYSGHIRAFEVVTWTNRSDHLPCGSASHWSITSQHKKKTNRQSLYRKRARIVVISATSLEVRQRCLSGLLQSLGSMGLKDQIPKACESNSPFAAFRSCC